MDVLKIVLTAVATVLAFYATTSMLLAQKQLLAATRLSGYLTYWQNWILEHNVSKFYAVGLLWNQEDQAIRKRGGGAAELIKLHEERKKQMAAIKEELEKGVEFDKSVLKDIKRHSKETVLEFSRVTKQNV
jgi:hypothetical protein